MCVCACVCFRVHTKLQSRQYQHLLFELSDGTVMVRDTHTHTHTHTHLHTAAHTHSPHGTHVLACVYVGVRVRVHTEAFSRTLHSRPTQLPATQYSVCVWVCVCVSTQGEGEVKILGRLARHWHPPDPNDTHGAFFASSYALHGVPYWKRGS